MSVRAQAPAPWRGHSIHLIPQEEAQLPLTSLCAQHSQRYPLSTFVRSSKSTKVLVSGAISIQLSLDIFLSL